MQPLTLLIDKNVLDLMALALKGLHREEDSIVLWLSVIVGQSAMVRWVEVALSTLSLNC